MSDESNEKSNTLQVPPWLFGAIVLRGGVSGAGLQATVVGSPAVLEQKITELSTKIAESREEARREADEMKAQISGLQSSVSAAGLDRFTRTDHSNWVSTDLRPALERIDDRYDALNERLREVERLTTDPRSATPRRR